MADAIDRALGAFSISAGSAAALATLVETEGNPRRRETNAEYDAIYINVATLARNAQASLNSANQATVMPAKVAELALEDLQHICNVAKDVKLAIVLYHTGDFDLRKNYPIGNHRLPSTNKQLFAKDYSDSMIGKVMAAFASGIEADVYPKLKVQITNKLATSVSSQHKKPIFMTSCYLDLIESKAEALLQSYTGVVIQKHDYWKLFSKSARLKERDLSRIPFNRLFIQIFGDSKSFYSRGYKELERILDLAEKRDWNQTTTKDRVRMTMKKEELWKEEYDEVEF